MLVLFASIELTAQLTTFMRTDVRADAQTTTELPAQLTTFMRTDVRADAQITIELTVQLTIESTTESTAQLIEKPIMRVCINDLDRPRKFGVSVTCWFDRSVNNIPANHIRED